jgi:hypothetical protein
LVEPKSSTPLRSIFKDVVKIASFVPLHPGSEIILDAGPGATIWRALKDAHYLAAVIQLSFLGWMHETTSLASVLVENMNQRFQSGIKDATPDPDCEGLLTTLQACLSQTSQYPWEILVRLVENKFQKSRSWLQLQRSPLKRLSPNTLLAPDGLSIVGAKPSGRQVHDDRQPDGTCSDHPLGELHLGVTSSRSRLTGWQCCFWGW